MHQIVEQWSQFECRNALQSVYQVSHFDIEVKTIFTGRVILLNLHADKADYKY